MLNSSSHTFTLARNNSLVQIVCMFTWFGWQKSWSKHAMRENSNISMSWIKPLIQYFRLCFKHKHTCTCFSTPICWSMCNNSTVLLFKQKQIALFNEVKNYIRNLLKAIVLFRNKTRMEDTKLQCIGNSVLWFEPLKEQWFS